MTSLGTFRYQRGLAGAAAIVVLLVVVLTLVLGRSFFPQGLVLEQRGATDANMRRIADAVVAFATLNKRLPCPADGRIAGNASGAGTEARSGGGICQIGGTANMQTHGVLPWQSLGLTEPDVTDGWGNRLTYRVAPELVLDNAMDLTACDPGGSAGLTGGFCNPTSGGSPCSSATFPGGCTPPGTYTHNKGLKIRNLASATLLMNPGLVPSTGAAYVVISHGENRQGAYNSDGILQEGSPASGTLEAANNAANAAFVFADSTSTSEFVDDFPSYVAGTGHFDDVLLRPAILTVANKAQLGPRAH